MSGFETYSCGGIPETCQAPDFSQQSGGWFSPIFPPGAVAAGDFTFMVQYAGRSYSYVAPIAPLQVTCFTLKVPSGNFSAPIYPAKNALSQCLSH